MLVTGAGLLIKSLVRLQRVDLGINPARVLTMQFSLAARKYREEPPVFEFAKRLVEVTKALPGVQAAAISNSLPPDETQFSSDFTIEGHAVSKDLPQIAYFNRVSPDYFTALGIPVRAGRSFTPADLRGSARVSLINETLRRRFFPGEDPVGKRLNSATRGSRLDPGRRRCYDVKYNGMADEVQPAIYRQRRRNRHGEVGW